MPTKQVGVAKLIALDGSHGEGGGQLLRNAMAFASILKKNISITKIRAGRSKPGLKAQHMTGMQLCAEISGGLLEGCELNSTSISYKAPQVESKEWKVEYVGNTRTAGSICLVLQAALPVVLFASKTPTDLILKGGTNATFAPQYDYWEHVFLPTLIAKCGLPDDLIKPHIVRRGYFPKGGGEVRIEVEQWHKPLQAIKLVDRGDVASLYIRCYHAGAVKRRAADDMMEAAKKVLGSEIKVDATVEIVEETSAVGTGCGILIVATTTTGCILAGSALGEPRKQADKVGREAATELVQTLRDGGCVDEWLQDQLLLFMALASGSSEMLTGSLTLHTRTAIWVTEQLCDAKFTVTRVDESGAGPKSGQDYGKDGRIPGKHLIQCSGIGYVNPVLEE